VRRLLVVDAEGRLGGVLSIDDLVEVIALQLGAVSGALRGGAAHEVERVQPGALSAGPSADPSANQHANPHPTPTPGPARSGVVFLPMGTPGMH
jgi:hypothetical protein